MKAIDRAKAHFDSLEIKKIHVPEWDMDIYAKPLNLFETKKLMRYANDDSVEMLAYVVMLKSLDEKGENPLGIVVMTFQITYHHTEGSI